MSPPVWIDRPNQRQRYLPIDWRGWSREVLLSRGTEAGLNG